MQIAQTSIYSTNSTRLIAPTRAAAAVVAAPAANIRKYEKNAAQCHANFRYSNSFDHCRRCNYIPSSQTRMEKRDFRASLLNSPSSRQGGGYYYLCCKRRRLGGMILQKRGALREPLVYEIWLILQIALSCSRARANKISGEPNLKKEKREKNRWLLGVH